MRQHYDDEYCLGVNEDQFSPEIKMYASWAELAEACRSGKIRNGSVPKKDSLPGVTYKGNYQDYRDQAHFVGDRTDYVVIDIDFDEEKNGCSKSDLRNKKELFTKVSEDLEVIKSELSPAGYFFLKKSTSGCGLHIVVRIEGLPASLHEASGVEKMIFRHVQAAIDSMHLSLHFRYIVDESLAAVTRVFFLSHDPHLVYDPDFPNIQMREEWRLPPQEPWSGTRTVPGVADREVFVNWAEECLVNRIRLQDGEIFNLSIIYHQLWPAEVDGEVDADSKKRFLELFRKFNKERSRHRPHERGYVERAYRHGKETCDAPGVNVHRVGLKTLYNMIQMDRPVDPDPFSNFPDFMQDFLRD